MDASGTFALFGDDATTMVSVLIFLATGTVAFVAMALLRSREAVRRRVSQVGLDGDGALGRRALRHSSVATARKLLDRVTKHYGSGDNNNNKETKLLRRRMLQAGIYDPNAVAYFFLARMGLAGGLALFLFIFLPTFGVQGQNAFWFFMIVGAMGGYLAPSFYLSRRVAKRQAEHRAGFPDFMDLLVVCADAGLAMEAALERVSRELGDSYPSLVANIHIANLEVRAGRTMTEALEHFGDRLGLEEARSFAALIQQSHDLGSSIAAALRVYSDDMRHKRLSRAEEKAYSLPAKLAVPMMVCIFPVLFVVILTPVIVKLSTGHW
jgi:tight adherence protein C